MGECAYDAFYICFKARVFGWVLQRGSARALHPAGVVHSRPRCALLAEFRIWVPTRIEKDKDRPDLVLCSNAQKCVEALLETFRVLLPKQIMQVYTHRVHADAFCPT